jgi:rhodanese-related sulfurtransferase
MAFAKTDAVKRVLESRESFLTNDYDFSCENHHVAKSVKEITVEDVQTLLNRGERIQFVDVRETTEPKSPRELLGLRIPSGEILHSIATIEKDGHVIIYCHSGVRSEKVVKKLQDEYAFENLLSLKGGAKAWVRFVKESENNIEMELS